MRCSHIVRLFRRMQRIREQQEAIAALRLVCREYGRLPAAIRVAAEENSVSITRTEGINGGLQAGTIFSRKLRRGRSKSAALPKR